MVPSFISEYRALYGELHKPAPTPHIKEIDERIARITKSLEEVAAFSESSSIPEDVKQLSSEEVADINRLARETLWNESGILKRAIIGLLRFVTFGWYTGVHQIPVKEFTASVASYIEKTKTLTSFLEPIPVVEEGFLEGCDVGVTKCYYIWKNSDANNALTVSVVNGGEWTHYRCNFSDFSRDRITLANVQNEFDKLTLFVKDLTLFEDVIETNLDAPAYGKVRFQEVMSPFIVQLPVDNYPTMLGLLRSCESLKKNITALTREGANYLVSTRDREGKITQERLSINSYGVVSLKNEDTGAVRTFSTVEQFKNSCFHAESISVLQARKFVKLGEKGQKLVLEQKKLISEGAKQLGLLASLSAVEGLKRELKEQLLYLEPSQAGGFVYETSDPLIVKVVYGGPDGPVEHDMRIMDAGVEYQNKGYPLDTTLNKILGLDEEPFVSMDEARAHLQRIMKDGVPLSALCKKMEKHVAFCSFDAKEEMVKEIYKANTERAKLAGLYMIVPPKPISRGWLEYIVGPSDTTFKNFTLFVDNGKELEALSIDIDPARGTTPYVYMAKHYPTVEAILKDQVGVGSFKPYKQFLPKVVPVSQPRPQQEQKLQPQPKTPEKPTIVDAAINLLTPALMPAPIQKPAQPQPAARLNAIDSMLAGFKGQLTNPTTRYYYSSNAKAAIKPRQALMAQLHDWRTAGQGLSKPQARAALCNLLLSESYQDSYPDLAAITAIRMQDLPYQGGKAARDELLTWVWSQK